MTPERYYDIEGVMVEALATSFKAVGLAAIEQQRGEERVDQRLEISAAVMGETGETDIDPHTGELYYSFLRMTLHIDLRTPSDQYDQHRAARGKTRSLLAYLGPVGGAAFVCQNQDIYSCENIRMAESDHALMVTEEDQNELSSLMNYELTIRLLPGARPAPKE